jgi:hypothetical protein
MENGIVVKLSYRLITSASRGEPDSAEATRPVGIGQVSADSEWTTSTDAVYLRRPVGQVHLEPTSACRVRAFSLVRLPLLKRLNPIDVEVDGQRRLDGKVIG